MWSQRKAQLSRVATIGLAVALGGAMAPLPASAAPATERISANSAGQPGDAPSDRAAVSADGRYVTFASTATNLVPGPDANGGYTDLYLRDRHAGTIERINVSSTGAQADDGSFPPARVSPDGRYVTFSSLGTNLARGDSGGHAQVYLRDRATNTTRRVSVNSRGAAGNAASYGGAVSANGRYVAFSSYADNLVRGDTNGRQDIFVRDLRLGTTRLVSVGAGGAVPGNGASSFPVISSGGRYVGFLSSASNLQPVDTLGQSNAYVKDLSTGAVDLVGVSAAGQPFARGSGDISMSADGRLVAFSTNESGPAGSQVYVRDRVRRTTVVASRAVDGRLHVGSVSGVSISPNGRYVAFIPSGDILVPGSHPGSIIVRDLATSTTTVGGVASSGRFIDGAQWEPAMSNTGVAFNTFASDVAPGGNEHTYQVYFHQL